MNTLTMFLLDRIAEDETVARATLANFGLTRDLEGPMLAHVAHFDPARIITECEAKRRIIDAAHETASQIDGEWGCVHDSDQIRSGDIPSGCYGPEATERFLKPLAQVYADHPDFDPAWNN